MGERPVRESAAGVSYRGIVKEQRGIFGRGIRLVWRYVRQEPLTYAVSLVGATIYASAAVGTTIVLGKVTNDVVVPAFTTGTPTEQVRGAALALLAVGWLRALSIVLRRYFAALTTFRTAAERGESEEYVDEVVDVVRRALGRPVRGAGRPS